MHVSEADRGGFLLVVLLACVVHVCMGERSGCQRVWFACAQGSVQVASLCGSRVHGEHSGLPPVFCQVTLGKVLKVIVVMRSLFIDRTIVKVYNENVYTEDGKVSMLASFVFSVIFCIPEQMYSSTR